MRESTHRVAVTKVLFFMGTSSFFFVRAVGAGPFFFDPDAPEASWNTTHFRALLTGAQCTRDELKGVFPWTANSRETGGLMTRRTRVIGAVLYSCDQQRFVCQRRAVRLLSHALTFLRRIFEPVNSTKRAAEKN